jgi:hypothetical protein
MEEVLYFGVQSFRDKATEKNGDCFYLSLAQACHIAAQREAGKRQVVLTPGEESRQAVRYRQKIADRLEARYEWGNAMPQQRASGAHSGNFCR